MTVEKTIESGCSRPVLEFWFDFASTYSYLAVMRIEALVRHYGVTLIWRPFLLGPIFKSMGWETSPFLIHEPMGKYMWKDMERQCIKYGVAWKKPSVFPRRSILPARIALVGAGESWVGGFCREVMRMNFEQDREIDDTAAMKALLDQLGVDGEGFVAKACQADNKEALRNQIEEARSRDVFGAPTFFADSTMYWGNDRLDDAIASLTGHPRRADQSLCDAVTALHRSSRVSG